MWWPAITVNEGDGVSPNITALAVVKSPPTSAIVCPPDRGPLLLLSRVTWLSLPPPPPPPGGAGELPPPPLGGELPPPPPPPGGEGAGAGAT